MSAMSFPRVVLDVYPYVWRRVKDEEKWYYWNIVTDEVRWTHPSTSLIDELRDSALFRRRVKLVRSSDDDLDERR